MDMSYRRRIAGPFRNCPEQTWSKHAGRLASDILPQGHRQPLTATDNLFRGSEAQITDTTHLTRISTRLNRISIPAARRLLAMRRSAVPSALGALGQRSERRMFSLIMQLSRASSSATVPLKPSWASLATGL